MNQLFDQKIINILNNWYENLTIEESDFEKFVYTKGKFRDRYLMKTGEFLKITKRLEAVMFNRICAGLSQNYDISEDLLDQYLDWCFENYDFFIKKYKAFNLINCASFAAEWKKDFLKFDFNDKVTIEDLKDIEVKTNIFLYFEKYGVVLACEKLSMELDTSSKKLIPVIIDKLKTLTNSKTDLMRLKNMLRATVENGPYPSSYAFSDYSKSLSELFYYFKSEPWCK